MSRPWMPLYVSDYLGDTRHLRTIEHGAYLLLMMHYWQSGGLPDDDERLARITGFLRLEDWLAVRPAVQAFFHDGWRHKRIDAEFGKSIERSKSGRMGGRPKANGKQNESKPQSKSEAPQLHPQEEIRGGRDAGARDPDFAAEAMKISEEIAAIAGYPTAKDWPPGWCGAPLRVQTFLASGWRRDVMLAAAREAMGRKRDGPPFSIAFFERPFARAHAQQSAPVPVTVISTAEPETIHARPGSSITDAADRLVQRLHDFDRGPEEIRSAESPPNVRLLSKR